MKRFIVALTLLTAIGAQAETMVHWGAPDTGADMFAASANHNPKADGVYAAGEVYGDETTHSGSSVAPIESQTYNVAAFATVPITISKDIHDTVGSGAADGGDSIFLQAPSSTSLKAMVVWENFATTNTTLDSIAVGGRRVGDSGTFSYLIERDNGDSTTSWYVSAPALTLANSYTSVSSAAPATLSWSVFTPLNGDGGVIGAAASPGMDGIVSVGVYADIAKASSGNTGFKLNYFSATGSGTNGPPVNQPPAFAADPFSKPDAEEGVAYTGSIAGNASDPESDPMTFSLTSSASWLSVAPSGALSGTPGPSHAGLNSFMVEVSATGGVDTATMYILVNAAPAPPTGWEEFVSTHGLSGDMFDDADSNGVVDGLEFAHGGNPTNPADNGAAPYLEYGTNDHVRYICMETRHTNPGITYAAEWVDNLVTGEWQVAWDATNRTPATLPGYDEVVREVDPTGRPKLFCRNRVFDASSTQRPNILFIQCDDLGYCDVGFNAAIFGEKATSIVSPQTPEIDTLASSGMVFTEAYVSHPFCGPSRMGLITGRYPHHFGGSKNLPYETLDLPDPPVAGYEPANTLGIPATEITMAKVLQDAGYHTGAIGKWHMGIAPHTHPNNVGFDYWFGFLGGGHNYYAPWLSKTNPAAVNDYQFWLTRNGSETNITEGYLTDILSEDAVSFITTTPAEQPFFLYLNYNAPHTPHQAKPEDLQLLFGGSGDNDDYESQELITAMMYAVDRGIGDIVDALNASGNMNNTMIVFLSDNGGKVLDDADNGPLTGGKGNTTEGGIRTPMFVHYPNAITPGSTYDHPVSMYDFYPTFAGLGEAAIPAGKVLSGTDIWDDILADQNANTHTMVWVRHNGGGHQVGLRNGNYKAHRLNFGVWRLYDLDVDIGETNDISGANTALLNNMISDGLNWSTNGVDPLWHDTQNGYESWETNNMPLYPQTFSP